MAYHLPWLHMEQASMSTVESCRRMSGIVSNNKYMQIQSQICKFQDIYIYIFHNKYIYIYKLYTYVYICQAGK